MDAQQFRDETAVIRDQLSALIARFDSEVHPAPLPSGSNLTLALEKGDVQLETNGTYEGTLTVKRVGSTLKGAAGARVIGSGGPGLYVPPGMSQFQGLGFEVTAPGYTEAAVRIGDNGSTQVRLDQEPFAIYLTDVTVPTHRGKRGFEINGRMVKLIGCFARDVWHSSFDSQGIGVLNSSGGVIVRGGEFEGGASMFMVGGDTVKMIGPDGKPVTPTDGLFDGVRLTRPLSWRTDGVKRGVKNIFEVKNGRNWKFINGYMSGCWKDAQTGEPIMLTPTRGGISVGTEITDTVIENVPAGFTLVGRHPDDYTPEASSVRIERCKFKIAKTIDGVIVGSGTLMKVGGEPDRLTMVDSLAQGVVSETLMEMYKGDVKRADGTKTAGGPIGLFEVNRNKLASGKYGFRLDGQQGGGPNGEGMWMVPNRSVADNTFGCDNMNAYQKRNFPGNAYIIRSLFDQQNPW